MSRVLVIDDDRAFTGILQRLLEREQFKVAVAHDGSEGLALACQLRFDAILIDLQLPIMSGIDLLRELHKRRVRTPSVILTGHGTIQTAVEAMRLGAIDYLEKPFTREGLVNALNRIALARADAGETPAGALPPVHHSAAKWACAVGRAVRAPYDPTTLEAWGRVANAAPGTLKSWCSAAGLSGRASLDFLRTLRAVVQARRANCNPSSLLDGDSRTLRRLMIGAGMTETHASATEKPTPLAFLERQRFVTDRIALSEILKLLDTL
jgi:ActR/RegA family two-component response regulator